MYNTVAAILLHAIPFMGVFFVVEFIHSVGPSAYCLPLTCPSSLCLFVYISFKYMILLSLIIVFHIKICMWMSNGTCVNNNKFQTQPHIIGGSNEWNFYICICALFLFCWKFVCVLIEIPFNVMAMTCKRWRAFFSPFFFSKYHNNK